MCSTLWWMLINQTLGTQFQRSKRSSDSSSSSSSESSSSDDEDRESKRSKSRSRRSKKEKKRRSRSKHSSSESEEADGPLPLSRFFGSVKSWFLLNGYDSTSTCTMLFFLLLIFSVWVESCSNFVSWIWYKSDWIFHWVCVDFEPVKKQF